MGEEFTRQVITVIKGIPTGKVMTYGQVAFMAGNPDGARQVSRILHSMSRKEKLPWHRVINRMGKISLPEGFGYEEQEFRLKREGVEFDENGRIDLKKFRPPGPKGRRF
jgi:methylated-DNA-protein-cysteine methyltransferase-like protein